jgi:hypothetical protein
VNPDACGKIDVTPTGRRLYAFLRATAEMQKQVAAINRDAKRACLAMAAELKLPAAQLQGDTLFVCKNVAAAVREGLDAGMVTKEAKYEVIYKPAVCTVDLDVAAQATAECEARAQADVTVVCQGECRGTCTGECQGACATRGADGACAGECQGICRGRCEGGCDGAADVTGEATCEASGEIRANLSSTCTDPVIETRYEPAEVKDPVKFEQTQRAIAIGLPQLLIVLEKMRGPVAASFAVWGKTVGQLYNAGSKLVDELEDASVCVLAQIGAAFAAVAQVEVQIQITIEASVEVGGACHAEASGS